MYQSASNSFSLTVLAIAVGFMSGCNKADHHQAAALHLEPVNINTATTLLTTINDDFAGSTLPGHSGGESIIFDTHGNSTIYVARKGDMYQVIYNGKPGGNPSAAIDFPTLSPDGRHYVYSATDGKARVVYDGKDGAPFDDVFPPMFSQDSKHMAYKARIGTTQQMVVDGKPSRPSFGFDSDPVFSADSSRIAFIEKPHDYLPPRFVVSTPDFSSQTSRDLTPEETVVYNKDKTRIALVTAKGKRQAVVTVDFANPQSAKEGPTFDKIERLAFGDDGTSLTFCGTRGTKTYIVWNDREEEIPAGELKEAPVIRPDRKGVGYILFTNGASSYHEAFSGRGEIGTRYEEAAKLAFSKDGTQYAYCARNGKRIVMVVNGKEGPEFDMILAPSFSPDGKLVVYRARKNGQRFVVVADLTGKVVSDYPKFETVHDVVFTPDGKSVAYGAKDGDKLLWRVEKLP